MDIGNLETKLDALTGRDYEECENEERKSGNNAVDVTLTKSFQARLAARAMGINPHEVKDLPLKQYSKVIMTVMRFLFADLETEETPLNGSEAQPQI